MKRCWNIGSMAYGLGSSRNLLKVKTKLDLNFCDFYYDSSKEKKINNTISLIKKSYLKNKIFFEKKIKKFSLILIYSRKEMDKYWKEKTPRWLIAFTANTKIYIFSPQVIERVSIHRKKAFYNTLIHEINHLFYYNIYKTYKPLWVSEGLASYLETKKNQFKISLNYKDLYNLKLPFSFIRKKYIKNVKEISYLSYLCIKFLLRNYNKRKLLYLLKLYSKKPKKTEFVKLFKKIYGFPFNSLTDFVLK